MYLNLYSYVSRSIDLLYSYVSIHKYSLPTCIILNCVWGKHFYIYTESPLSCCAAVHTNAAEQQINVSKQKATNKCLLLLQTEI